MKIQNIEHTWQHITAKRNPLNGHWLIMDATKPSLAFYVTTEKAALGVIEFVKNKKQSQNGVR